MMDEVNTKKKKNNDPHGRVMVVAATNLPHLIDKSLLRPGNSAKKKTKLRDLRQIRQSAVCATAGPRSKEEHLVALHEKNQF